MKRSNSKDCLYIISTQNEKKIFKIYKEEFNELYCDILNLSSCKFIQNCFKRTKLGSSHKLNDFSQQEILQVEKYISDSYYPLQYKLGYATANQINAELSSSSPSKIENSIYFNGQNFLKHCNENTVPLHTCGEKFILSHQNYDEHTKNLMLYCPKCNQIYNKDFVKMKCNHCEEAEFYSKLLITKEEREGKMQMATWAKYHCGALINDTMKCIKCKETFYFDPTVNGGNGGNGSKILMCLNCGFKTESNLIMWKCVFCKKEFESDVKIYNPYEFKLMKIAVKDTLMNKIKAIPPKNEFKCGCKIDYGNTKFYHQKNCHGEMLLGQIEKKKILVCSLCHSLNFYDSFLWSCPVCEKKFLKNEMMANSQRSIHNRTNSNGDSSQNEKIRYNSQQKKRDDKGPKLIRRPSHDKSKHSPNKNFILPIPSGKKGINGGVSSNKKVFDKQAQPYQQYQINNCITEVDNKENINNNLYINRSNSKNKNNNVNPNVNMNISNNIKNIKIGGIDFKKKLLEKFNSSINEDFESKKEEFNHKWIENFNADDYEIKKKIGEGSFGKIYMVEDRNKNRFALKKLISTTEEELQALTHEYKILKTLCIDKNIDIINIYGVQTKKLDRTTFVVYILMELANTDWEKEVLKRYKCRHYYTEEELVNLMKCLLKTLSELQVENVSHRDIKPQNILVCPGNIYKVADFGEAKELKKNRPDTVKQTIRGTELFMSPILFNACSDPKIYQTKHNTFKSDVWSLGLCFLFAGTLTYDPVEEIRTIQNDNLIDLLLQKNLGNRYSQKFIGILEKMLKINEKERIDFIEAEREVNIEYI